MDVEREPEPQTGGLVSSTPGLAQQISFSSVDYTIDDHDAVDPDELLREQQQKQQEEEERQQQERDAQETKQKSQQPTQRLDSISKREESEDQQYCIAMYDYDATCDEELTFVEGEIITLLNKEPHDVDDGWWKGEVRGEVGLFPSLVVEICASDGSPLTPEVGYKVKLKIF